MPFDYNYNDKLLDRHNPAFEREAITPELMEPETKSSAYNVSNEARIGVDEETANVAKEEEFSSSSSKASSARARRMLPWGKYEGQGVGT